MLDPYAVLGVSPTATPAEITQAYRHHLRARHPDMHAGQSDSVADEQLRQILAAYFVLRDPTRRAAYDLAHPARREAGPIRVKVTHIDSAEDPLAVWAGPVRWHR